MAHKIGITLPVRLELYKGELKEQYPSLYNWRVIASGVSYSDAEKIEIQYKQRGYLSCSPCEYVPDPIYCVFAFDY